MITELPSYLVPIATVGYETGIRKGELKKIEWEQVDFNARLIRLRSGQTKGGKPRTVPFLGDMRDRMAAFRASKSSTSPNGTDTISDTVPPNDSGS